MKDFNRESISRTLDKIREYVPNPAWLAGGIGLLGSTLGLGLWENIVQTGGSLGRYPIRKLTGMSNEEYDQAMEDMANDNRYRFVIPAAVGLLLGGGYLAAKYNKNQEGKGLTSWTPKTASFINASTNAGDSAEGNNDFFYYSGYVPKIDYGKVIDARQFKSLVSNDNNLKDDPYVRNMELAVVNNASRNAGFVNPTLGNIYDSTASKMKSKLSWQGVTGVAANTMLANATAHLFTAGLDALMGLSPEAQRNIVDTATWATFAKSIFT